MYDFILCVVGSTITLGNVEKPRVFITRDETPQNILSLLFRRLREMSRGNRANAPRFRDEKLDVADNNCH